MKKAIITVTDGSPIKIFENGTLSIIFGKLLKNHKSPEIIGFMKNDVPNILKSKHAIGVINKSIVTTKA